jgi:hypothetical protein
MSVGTWSVASNKFTIYFVVTVKLNMYIPAVYEVLNSHCHTCVASRSSFADQQSVVVRLSIDKLAYCIVLTHPCQPVMGWFIIRAFLATILSPFRSTFPMDVPWLFHSSPLVMTFSVALWREALRRDPLYLQCMVERIVFCKCDARKQHEFLVINFRHHALNHSAPVVVDRAVLQESQDTSSVKQAQQCSTVKSPTLSTTPAADFVHLIGNNCHLKPYLTRTFGKYAELCIINFPADVDRPSVMQVATLLTVVHQQAPQYDVYQNQCHWFACTAWDALVTLFPGQHGACKSHVTRSRYHGFPIDMAGSVAAVLDKHASEWETTITEVRTHRTIRVAEEEQVSCLEGQS